MTHRTWFDLTTVARSAPPATGIPRVELALAEALIEAGGDVGLCLYDARLGRYCELPRPAFAALSRRYRSPETGSSYVELDVAHGNRTGAEGRGIFGPRDLVVTGGFNWRAGYVNMPHLYALRDAIGLRIAAVCYDVIPILFPAFVPGMVNVFVPYMAGVVRSADHLLCISECTRRDVAEWATKAGIRIGPSSVMPLGSQLAHDGAAASERVAAIAEPFVLCVGTVEMRKNQRVLCQAYAALVDAGATQLPRLVLVGQIGHGGRALVDEVAADARLRERVTILSDLPDADLMSLYARCLFTLYPSFYEGWGLPVSESLAAGKPCIASDGGSLPEAGGDFCDYVAPDDVAGWSAVIRDYLDAPQRLAVRTADIRARYRAPGWDDAARHVLAISADLPPKDAR